MVLFYLSPFREQLWLFYLFNWKLKLNFNNKCVIHLHIIIALGSFRTTQSDRRRYFKVRQVVLLYFPLVNVKLRFGSPESEPFSRFETDFKPVPFSGCCVSRCVLRCGANQLMCITDCWSSHSRPTCFTELHFCPTALPPCWADSSCKWLLGPKWQASETGPDRVKGAVTAPVTQEKHTETEENVGSRSFQLQVCVLQSCRCYRTRLCNRRRHHHRWRLDVAHE